MNETEALKLELKKQIIAELNLEEIEPNDIDDNAPLFGEGLGLDSIDALELVVLMEIHHGVKVRTEAEGRDALQSINSMVEYIESHKRE